MQSLEPVVICDRAWRTIAPEEHHPNPISTVANDDQSPQQPAQATRDATWRTTLAAAQRVLEYHSGHTPQQPVQTDEPDKAEALRASTD